jgi:hypothetical protein
MPDTDDRRLLPASERLLDEQLILDYCLFQSEPRRWLRVSATDRPTSRTSIFIRPGVFFETTTIGRLIETE